MRRIVRFLKHGLWEIDLRERSFPVRFAYGALRVVLYVVGKFEEHLIGVRAAGLTTATLLALVPLVTVVLAAARGLGVVENLDTKLDGWRDDQSDVWQGVIDYVRTVVDQTDFQALGFAGSLIFAYSAYALFLRTEEALNFAWRVRSRLVIWTRLSTFVSLVVLVPLLLVGAFAGSSVMMNNTVSEWVARKVPWAYEALLDVVPYALASLAMTGLFKFMPSTKVRWRSAFLSGLIAGCGLIAVYEIYVSLQLGVGRQGQIYGTLAALPLLVVFLQTSWTVVVVAAETGYALQNLHLIGPGRDLQRMAPAVREELAWRLCTESISRFNDNQGPLSLAEAASEFDLPIEWLEQIAEDLAEEDVLVFSKDGSVSPGMPTTNIDRPLVATAVHGKVPESLDRRMRRAFREE
ncbi:MAG: YihY/virulence factor BrkB family protein [Planctomycetota bacterium]